MFEEDESFEHTEERVDDILDISNDQPGEEMEGNESPNLPVKDGKNSALSEDELDQVADAAIEILRNILSHFNIGEAEINEYEGDDYELILDVAGADLAILIGHHGRTLSALQLLVTTILRKRLGFHYPVTIDVEGYKNRQRQKIESMAYAAASRACRQDREIQMRPMNPYERRLVHMALRTDERVETYSVGTNSDRHVVIRPL